MVNYCDDGVRIIARETTLNTVKCAASMEPRLDQLIYRIIGRTDNLNLNTTPALCQHLIQNNRKVSLQRHSYS